MDFREEYKQKLVSADEAVKLIKSGDWVDYGCAPTPLTHWIRLSQSAPTN